MKFHLHSLQKPQTEKNHYRFIYTHPPPSAQQTPGIFNFHVRPPEWFSPDRAGPEARHGIGREQNPQIAASLRSLHEKLRTSSGSCGSDGRPSWERHRIINRDPAGSRADTWHARAPDYSGRIAIVRSMGWETYYVLCNFRRDALGFWASAVLTPLLLQMCGSRKCGFLPNRHRGIFGWIRF